jgi:hypothetical protein
MGEGGNGDGRPSASHLYQNNAVVHVCISIGDTTLIGNNDGSKNLNYV